MVIDNFNLKSIAILPNKTKSPLIVDANTMPPFEVAMQSLQTIARR